MSREGRKREHIKSASHATAAGVKTGAEGVVEGGVEAADQVTHFQ